MEICDQALTNFHMRCIIIQNWQPQYTLRPAYGKIQYFPITGTRQQRRNRHGKLMGRQS